MSRPAPVTIAQLPAYAKNKGLHVMGSTGVYAVMHNGQPINISSHNKSGEGHQQPIYKKTNFATPGAAFNLADKLNKRSDTTDYEVYEMIRGDKITEEL